MDSRVRCKRLRRTSVQMRRSPMLLGLLSCPLGARRSFVSDDVKKENATMLLYRGFFFWFYFLEIEKVRRNERKE